MYIPDPNLCEIWFGNIVVKKNPDRDNIPGSESAYRILFSCQEVAKMEGIALFDQVSYIRWHLGKRCAREKESRDF